MSWSKVSKRHRKPLKWWYHKIVCEFWYHMYLVSSCTQKYYYKHLNLCCRQGFNLYGEKI